MSKIFWKKSVQKFEKLLYKSKENMTMYLPTAQTKWLTNLPTEVSDIGFSRGTFSLLISSILKL